MLGACSPKLALAQHDAPFISVQSKVVCFQYFMKLHGFDLQRCVQTSSFGFIFLGDQGAQLLWIAANLKQKLVLAWTQTINCC